MSIKHEVKPTQKQYYAFLKNFREETDCIDLTSMPENFAENFNAKKFAQQIIEAGSVKFMMFGGDNYDEWMVALQRLKSKIDSEEWSKVVKHLYPQYAIIVWGSDPWVHVFFNGGVAFRNYHRILAIDFNKGIMLESLDWNSIRSDINTMLKKAETNDSVAEGLLWNGPEGIQWCERYSQLPEDLPAPDGGQMLLVTHTYTETVRGLPIFGNDKFMSFADESEVGEIAYRIFPERVIAYYMYRHSDDADILMEEFSSYPEEGGEDPSTSEQLSSNYSDELRCRITEGAREIAEGMLIPESLRTDLTEQFCSTHVDGWPKDIMNLMNEFPVIFTRNWQEASLYCPDPLIKKLKLGKGEFAIEFNKYERFETPELLYDWLSIAKTMFNNENINGYIVFSENNVLITAPINVNGIEAIHSPVESWMTRVNAILQSELQEHPDFGFSFSDAVAANDENDRLERLLICGKFDTVFNIHCIVRELTEATEAGNILIIPELGLEQGYEPGNKWGLGNMDIFRLREFRGQFT